MDRRYSYSPNSRGARRARERKRKKRRNRRIAAVFIALLIICGGVYGGMKIGGGNLGNFHPVQNAAKLVREITSRSGKENADSQTPAPGADTQGTPAPEEAQDAEPLPTDDAEPLESDFWDDERPVSNAGVYPAASENNNLLDIFKNAEGETEKVCCLTFDDGPNSATTPQILDTLKKYNVKATFFMLGERIAENGELAKRVYEEGHLLANHTYTQKYSTIYKSWDSFWGEVEKTEELICGITGEDAFRAVRFPGGSFNSGVYGSVKQDFKTKLAEKGYYYIDWSADNGDDGTRNAAAIADYVKNNYGSKPMVMLMEDSSGRKATAQSLAAVIEYLQSRGYVFKRLDEIKYYTEESMPYYNLETKQESGFYIFEKRGRF